MTVARIIKYIKLNLGFVYVESLIFYGRMLLLKFICVLVGSTAGTKFDLERYKNRSFLLGDRLSSSPRP
jgi:hypothetical protein